MTIEVLCVWLGFIVLAIAPITVWLILKLIWYYHMYRALTAYFIDQIPDAYTVTEWYAWAKSRTVSKLLKRKPPRMPQRLRKRQSSLLDKNTPFTVDALPFFLSLSVRMKSGDVFTGIYIKRTLDRITLRKEGKEHDLLLDDITAITVLTRDQAKRIEP